ncbi:hypothetical protein WICPIJ_000277 [Wickerhamomyces pijperi]|uniref:Uncharacterized protein n=1 Tax=Wickerhamomyces pijperi TaxID=599730 RepID=A0A9P8QE31_WICPI|nr:hypothetical protein WICPIJ_000277 [Wickerhamomyces pijperi]
MGLNDGNLWDRDEKMVGYVVAELGTVELEQNIRAELLNRRQFGNIGVYSNEHQLTVHIRVNVALETPKLAPPSYKSVACETHNNNSDKRFTDVMMSVENRQEHEEAQVMNKLEHLVIPGSDKPYRSQSDQNKPEDRLEPSYRPAINPGEIPIQRVQEPTHMQPRHQKDKPSYELMKNNDVLIALIQQVKQRPVLQRDHVQ